MNISDLIDALQAAVDSGNVKPDAHVVLLSQAASWPLAHEVGELATLEAFTDREDGATVYITEGASLGYGPSHTEAVPA